MADKSVKSISLKALVDKRSNKVIFIESDNDFVDVLFSFLTIPMGKIIRLASSHSMPVEIGCMTNLYSSVENLHVQNFKAEGYRAMLLCPLNAAHSHFQNLKLKLEDEPTRYFLCSSSCTRSYNLLSNYKGVLCQCKEPMDKEMSLLVREIKKSSSAAEYGGVFLKGLTRFIISDDLQVMSPLCSEVSSLFTKLGVTDASSTEEMTLNVGLDEVLNLFMCSFESKTPLSEALLNHKPEPKLCNENVNQGICIEPEMAGDTVNEEGNISLKLIVSKSKKRVCYAEAGEDFVNLLFSFLTLPLGFVLKQLGNGSWKGCIDQLHKSVQDVDEQYFQSDYYKEVLLNPKIYPGFCYKDHLLGTEDVPVASYYYAAFHTEYFIYEEFLAADKSLLPSSSSSSSPSGCNRKTVPLILKYCKSQYNDECAQGFVKGPALFTVTDSLIIRPISPLLGLSILNELKVPFSDLEEQIVQVGKEEAVRLLVTSFLCDSALTKVFIRGNQRKINDFDQLPFII